MPLAGVVRGGVVGVSRAVATRAPAAGGAKRQTPIYVTGSKIKQFQAGRDGLGLNESWELSRDVRRET